MKRPQLFLIPFAGGSHYSFQFITPFLDEFEVIPLELPGRGKRLGEALLRDFDIAAQDILNQVMVKLKNSTYLIYGHSMGAYLSLRVSGLLERLGRPPAYLIVSGNPGPGALDRMPSKRRYLMKPDEFKAELREIGGMP